MHKLLALVFVTAIATPAFALKAHRFGHGPARTIGSEWARDVVRQAIAKQFRVKSGYRVNLTPTSLMSYKFTALGPKGSHGMRFAATGTVRRSPAHDPKVTLKRLAL